MDRIKFSIIIPIYKVVKDFLIECLDSAINQTYKDIEIIIVLNNANSEVSGICKDYSKKFNSFRIIEQSNGGVSASRNFGIEHAKGDWIMFLDADDWLELDCCEHILKIVENNEIDMVLFNHTKEWYNKSIKINHNLKSDSIYDTSDVDIKELFYRRAMGNPNTKLKKNSIIYYCWDKVYRRNFIVDNNIQFPIDLPKSEDKIFVLRCFKCLKKIYFLDKYYYHYRQNNQSMCNSYYENADSVRFILANYLKNIAFEMNSEISYLKNDKCYNKITADYENFLFGIISDVLLQKYFHKDYPYGRKKRSKDAYDFIRSEPFWNAMKSVKYSDLPINAKIKKFLLSYNLISLFCFIKKMRKNQTRF